MPPNRVNARVGQLFFDQRYADPTVDVTSESNTVEKETVDNETYIQVIGRRADRITITGIIAEDDVRDIDQLVGSGEVEVRTHRWSGTAVVLETDTTYTHSYDIAPASHVDSEWLYEVTLDLIEVDEVPSRAHELGRHADVPEELAGDLVNSTGVI